MTTPSALDRRFMRYALTLAARGLGRVAPNPSVGCVIARGETVVGVGVTQPGGRPHAEVVALDQAGSSAKGAAAYVSLEPCAHTGQTGPCTQALIAAGVKRVVAAVEDPDVRTKGKGLAQLEKAGIEVVSDVMAAEASRLNQGFFLARQQSRPLFSLKMATTLDGKIALSGGESQWITGPQARQYGHALRANHDAILVGAGTARADNPMLDCRVPGLQAQSPIRLVLTKRPDLALDSQLAKSARLYPVWLLHEQQYEMSAALAAMGVKSVPVASTRDLAAVAGTLAAQGLTRILVEGGSQILGSFLRASLADRLYHFSAPKLIGADGIAAIAPLALERLEIVPNFRLMHRRALGRDLLSVYEPIS